MTEDKNVKKVDVEKALRPADWPRRSISPLDLSYSQNRFSAFVFVVETLEKEILDYLPSPMPSGYEEPLTSIEILNLDVSTISTTSINTSKDIVLSKNNNTLLQVDTNLLLNSPYYSLTKVVPSNLQSQFDKTVLVPAKDTYNTSNIKYKKRLERQQQRQNLQQGQQKLQQVQQKQQRRQIRQYWQQNYDKIIEPKPNACRQIFAQTRPRRNGRFVSMKI